MDANGNAFTLRTKNTVKNTVKNTATNKERTVVGKDQLLTDKEIEKLRHTLQAALPLAILALALLVFAS